MDFLLRRLASGGLLVEFDRPLPRPGRQPAQTLRRARATRVDPFLNRDRLLGYPPLLGDQVAGLVDLGREACALILQQLELGLRDLEGVPLQVELLL